MRGLHNFFYDPKTGRKTARAFKGMNVSVSCPCYLPMDQLLGIFSRDLNKPDREQHLVAVASFPAATLRAVEIKKEKSTDPQKSIDVFYAPVPPGDEYENIAHCEIRGVIPGNAGLEITQGMANKIWEICTVTVL